MPLNKMEITTLISVITENRTGVLAEIAEAMGSANINIDALAGEGLGEIGIIRIVTNDPKRTAEILQKRNFKIVESEVFVINVPNRPGQLKKISDVLSQKRLNIEFIYQQTSEDKGSSKVIIKVNENYKSKARDVLEDAKF
ncbi:MAG: ACT domain-containing protein [Candidatus Altiarchaeum hamiconexum]|mgnify:CR=1 FL=1|uniref:ACT domain-containing protein n=1 Tax=Candidatus Altarchaeum hamiconexum TaxID=1803513 RepID=A0A8J8CEJ3_9ARCH|nr:ACT domain-containing protein [Candidatus Altarchaeum hamiconexum]OIQ06032.1 MAG: hypothetical protein AUK59_01475 [Candidatus Altarchaeum sp. CG2_30_32_3053]PIN66881.1 MAG: hypothetical protein COV98_05890 [Candidatus Altarchaeum sp. CG12_big_fil_rev_8_21_14_0_65_33_22]PIV27317.1 MAG: hypothetical protein COS36_06220 [Candidatus Altarchaeum sp. CG03_land_8_20_14_0_80_32_618]PIX48243.1 MAG: hypothetical protein COZ53_04625 [Candidatus Altarchaeum sp. CG_4_8_14_3_um_filter_33_2054]